MNLIETRKPVQEPLPWIAWGHKRRGKPFNQRAQSASYYCMSDLRSELNVRGLSFTSAMLQRCLDCERVNAIAGGGLDVDEHRDATRQPRHTRGAPRGPAQVADKADKVAILYLRSVSEWVL